MLSVEHISKKFKNAIVLSDVSFAIKLGEVVSISGRSGVGKSTIGRVICGITKPETGIINYFGKPLVGGNIPYKKSIRPEIALISQQPVLSLDPKQKVGNAIAEVLIHHCFAKSKAEAMEKVVDILAEVWLDKEIASRYPSQISGGQAQRIVIARALAVRPKLLIADEATSMLDIVAQAQIIQIFKALMKKQNMSILMISHNKPLISAFSDRIYTLENGKLN